LISPATISG